MKSKKIRMSKVKKNNIKKNTLARQGKLRKKTKKVVKVQKPVQKPVVVEPPSENEDDVMDMLDEEELEYIKKAGKKAFTFLEESKKEQKNKGDDIEERYEKNVLNNANQNGQVKEVKVMLPIKTKDGRLQMQVIEKTDDDDDNNENKDEEEDEEDNDEVSNEEEQKENEDKDKLKDLDIQSEPVSMAKLLATREEIIQSRKFQIGLLCSNILENPELHIKKISQLIEFLSERNPETYLTVRKLAMASLLEVFKDILPSYQILEIKQEGVKLKKETLKLQNYEHALLKYYKNYLQCLEKNAKLLRKSYASHERNKRDAESKLAAFAISCMGAMLVSQPYFNFAKNIVNFLIPFLDCKQKEVREIVMKDFSQIFKNDTRVELSLQIVTGLNKYIKQRKHCVHPEILQVFLSLKIKEIDLEKEKAEDLKKKELEARKKRIINLSKKERKRNKKLQEVEKEMLETEAEENKQSKHKHLTGITNILFTIYFRILKQAPTSKVLSACLEGLAKFTHCINVEYYLDLVNCLDNLLENENLGFRERLNCISTVFTILSGHGSNLNIDPRRFYSYLYKDLYSLTSIKNSNEINLIIKVLTQALIGRHKSIEQSRLLGFVKRIGTVSLILQHHGALGMLGVIKNLMQLGSKARILLDTENVGDGIYLPELEEPEYCNAHCTSLWELTALQRHYHSTVRNIAQNIAWEVPATGRASISPEISKLSPEELCDQYDPSFVSFKPAIPPPKKRKTE